MTDATEQGVAGPADIRQRALRQALALQAMGIVTYIPRRSIPGVPSLPRLTVRGSGDPVEKTAPALRALVEEKPSVPATPPADEAQAPVSPAPGAAATLSVVAVSAGERLWLEELAGEGPTRDQVRLIAAMAGALAGRSGRPEPVHFAWPPHGNAQFDLSREAALQAFAGFLRRRVEQARPQAVIILGADTLPELESLEPDVSLHRVRHSSARLLREPLRKREAWLDLAPLAQG